MIPRAVLAVAYATGRASHERQVTGDDTDKKGYPGPPGWGFGVGLTTPHKKLIVAKVEKRKKLDRFNDDGESWWQIGKNGRILFDRPKPTAGCSASGRRRRRTPVLSAGFKPAILTIKRPHTYALDRTAIGIAIK
jgi:hypothetical protein